MDRRNGGGVVHFGGGASAGALKGSGSPELMSPVLSQNQHHAILNICFTHLDANHQILPCLISGPVILAIKTNLLTASFETTNCFYFACFV